MEVCKRVFCCHKNDLKPLGRILELQMKILAVFTMIRENRIYLLLTNRLIILVELLMWCLTSKDSKFMLGIPFLPSLLQILTVHVKQRVDYQHLLCKEAFIQYMICYGVLTKLKTKVFQFVSGPLDLSDTKNTIPNLLLNSVNFLEAVTMSQCVE